jgi:nicotinamide riboside kinase
MEDLVWPTADFDAIARRQNELEDQLAAEGGPVLVCDTDAYVTGMWHERYLHDRSRSVDAEGRHHPLYLVTHHDGVPFHQDGIRDGEHLRAWMTERFIDDLTRTGRTFVVLTGTVEQRVSAGLDAIDRMLGDWVVAAPVAAKMP